MAELVHSIREVGLLQPVVVRAAGPDTYELVMGERRWRAAQEAGLTTIPAIVRQTDDGDMLRDALLENLHRSQLNPLEEAAAYSAAARRLLLHPRGARRADRPLPAADQQHHPAAQALARRPATGRRRRPLGRPCPLPARPSRTPTARTGSPGVWSPRGSACGASRRSCRSGSRRRRSRRSTGASPPHRASRISPSVSRTGSRRGSRSTSASARGRSPSSSRSLDDLRRIVDIMDPRNRSDRPI